MMFAFIEDLGRKQRLCTKNKMMQYFVFIASSSIVTVVGVVVVNVFVIINWERDDPVDV